MSEGVHRTGWMIVLRACVVVYGGEALKARVAINFDSTKGRHHSLLFHQTIEGLKQVGHLHLPVAHLQSKSLFQGPKQRTGKFNEPGQLLTFSSA